MKVNIEEKIGIPQSLDVNVENNKVSIKSNKGSLEKNFFYPKIGISKENNKIILRSVKASKNEKRILNTFKAHIKNMIKGLEDSYCYTLKICSSHFPINVSVEKRYVIIKNFLGEKSPRKAKIVEGTEVEVNGEEITVKGIDKDKVGQTSANIELSTKITKRDRRVFADGIYITNKAK